MQEQGPDHPTRNDAAHRSNPTVHDMIWDDTIQASDLRIPVSSRPLLGHGFSSFAFAVTIIDVQHIKRLLYFVAGWLPYRAV
jgi:hypothetical protein